MRDLFSNPEDASLHINNVWDNVDEWWYSKDVKNVVSELKRLTCLTSDNSINVWTKFLKNQISKNDKTN